MNIQPIGFLETDVFQATFTTKYRNLLTADLHGLDTLVLRTETEDMPLLAEWKSARNLLSRVRNGAAPFMGGRPADLGCVELQRLKPNTATPWRVDDREDIHRLHLCIIPSPAAYVYSGHEQVIMPVGMVNAVNHRVLHSEANFGDHARVHLVIDVKIPDVS